MRTQQMRRLALAATTIGLLWASAGGIVPPAQAENAETVVASNWPHDPPDNFLTRGTTAEAEATETAPVPDGGEPAARTAPAKTQDAGGVKPSAPPPRYEGSGCTRGMSIPRR